MNLENEGIFAHLHLRSFVGRYKQSWSIIKESSFSGMLVKSSSNGVVSISSSSQCPLDLLRFLLLSHLTHHHLWPMVPTQGPPLPSSSPAHSIFYILYFSSYCVFTFFPYVKGGSFITFVDAILSPRRKRDEFKSARILVRVKKLDLSEHMTPILNVGFSSKRRGTKWCMQVAMIETVGFYDTWLILLSSV